MTEVVRWTPPQDVRDAGVRAQGRIPYGTGTEVREGEVGQLAIKPGTTALRTWVLQHFQGFTSAGARRDSERWHQVGERRDPHEMGIAVDFMTHDRAAGDALANWLVLNAEAIPVQYVLWYRREWGSSRNGAAWEDYDGAEDHTNHVHVELSAAAAANPALGQLLDTLWSRRGQTQGGNRGLAAAFAAAAFATGLILAREFDGS